MNGYMDMDLKSFWSHYHAAQKWMKVENSAVEFDLKCNQIGQQQPYDDLDSLNKTDNDKGLQNTHLDQTDCDEISPEFLVFYQKTMEHRKQRDQNRHLQQLKSNSHVDLVTGKDLQTKNDVQQKESKLVSLYGEEASRRVRGIELSIQKKFEEEHCINKHKTWPNIPMRFVR